MRILTLAAAAAVLSAAAPQSAPSVVDTWPANGATVSPGETTIRITFSEPMARDGMSLTVAGAAEFPKPTSPPQFSADGLSLSFKASLQPGKTYGIGVNGPSHKNFRSDKGVPATPAVVIFKTHRNPPLQTRLPPVEGRG